MDEQFTGTVADDVDEIAATVPGDAASATVEVHRAGPHAVAASAYDVDRLLASTGAFAATELAAIDGSLVDHAPIGMDHLAAWCTSTVTVDGKPVPAWADLSGVYETADGRHLQLHCNFAHHAAGVVEHLGIAEDRGALAAAVASRDGLELETELIERGMIAALVRSPDEWDAHPHARATRHLPVVTVERLGDADGGARPVAPTTRVLDCSRVLAGPVAGQLFAMAGCDVLRLGAAHLPSVEIGVLSTGFGKRAAFADLRTDPGRDAMADLLAGADVWIDAFRPGSLAAAGFDAQRAAEARPGIVVVQINAFDAGPDTDGPWAGRRGYDSIVQSSTGVRWVGGTHATGVEAPTPRGLPVQALDFATGFLAAGVAANLLRHQRAEGGSWLARLSLLRTRNQLVGYGDPARYEPRGVDVPDHLLDDVVAPTGRVRTVRPFVGRWTGPPMPLGSAAPTW